MTQPVPRGKTAKRIACLALRREEPERFAFEHARYEKRFHLPMPPEAIALDKAHMLQDFAGQAFQTDRRNWHNPIC